MISKYSSKFSCLAMIAGMFVTPLTHAVTIDLTYSNNATGHISGDPWSVTNHIPNDGTTYATVTIEESSTTGVIDFTVDLNASYWGGICDVSTCGIQTFGFNLTGGATSLTAGDVLGLPVSTGGNPNHIWSADVSGNSLDGMGMFDVEIAKAGSPDRQDPLTFSIDMSGDNILDYVTGSQAGANGSFEFALHIAGFTDQNPLDPNLTILADAGLELDICETSQDPGSIEGCNVLTSVWVGNQVAVVPVPAAVWLFGSGLLGLVGIARRKTA